MSEPVATPSDLAGFLGVDAGDSSVATRMETLISLAQSLCETIVTPCPAAAKAVVIGVAGRAFTNPQNLEQQSAGPYAANYGSAAGGLYLTKQDRSTLRRVAGRSGAFSVDMTPPLAGTGLPWWDRSGVTGYYYGVPAGPEAPEA